MDRILLFSVKICDVDTLKQYSIFCSRQKEQNFVLTKKYHRAGGFEPGKIAKITFPMV